MHTSAVSSGRRRGLYCGKSPKKEKKFGQEEERDGERRALSQPVEAMRHLGMLAEGWHGPLCVNDYVIMLMPSLNPGRVQKYWKGRETDSMVFD